MSTRGTRTVYRERDIERDYEEEPPRRTYTTVKRYQVPESITRAVHQEDDHVQDKIVIKRERRDDPPPPPRSHYSHHTTHRSHDDDVEWKFTERRYEPSRERDELDFRFIEKRSERSADPPRRDIKYRVVERDSDYERPRSEFRVVERDTEIARAPSPPSPERVREFRFERDRSWSPQRERPYDLERYSKSTEYFAQPQPIIIRESAPQAPIIIREERREPQKIIIRREEPRYEFIERKDIDESRDESRSLVRKEPEPEPEPEPDPEPTPEEPTPQPQKQPEEDYFYERRVVERRRRSDSYERKTEIRPRDSASNYSSDDSYEYVRRETNGRGGDDRDPRHKRHLAEGAIAGLGAAEILRHHRKSNGEPVSGRGRSALGGAAVGALGAEALTRVRSMSRFRRGSSSRSRSGDRRSGDRERDRERQHRRKRRSRSRSQDGGGGPLQNLQDLSRAQKLGGLAAVAGVAALAGYAIKNRNDKKETVIVNEGGRRRSRSRRRTHSVGSGYFSDDDRTDRQTSEHRDPDHRNRRIAQAGLASAAAAGIWERVRSRSRGGRERSKSRVRQGVPIAAAGLGGAALAGLYEKNKANKEAKKDAIIEDEMGRGRRRHSRSRSRSRSVPAPYPEEDRRSVDGPGLIAYGHDPIYPDERHGQYSDEEPALYRRRGGSSGSSPDTRRRRDRSHSRGRNLAEMGAAAGAAGVAAHELGRRRERSRADRERRREEDDYYDREGPPPPGPGYGNEPYSPPPPMVDQGAAYNPNNYQNVPFGQQQPAYPTSNYFPPPPTGEQAQDDPYAHAHSSPNSYPAYNPAEWANQPPQQHPYGHDAYGDGDANPGYAYRNENFAGDARYGSQDPGYDQRGRGRPDPENVSAPSEVDNERESRAADGVSTPRARSASRVRFDLDSNVTHSPELGRRKDDAKRGDPAEPQHGSDSEDKRHRRHRRRGKERERDGDSHRDRDRDRDRDPEATHEKHERRRDERGEDSEEVEVLPDRFDENGNKKAEDPLANQINQLLSGQGGLGGLFKAITGGNDERDDDSRTSRRRHRR